MSTINFLKLVRDCWLNNVWHETNSNMLKIHVQMNEKINETWLSRALLLDAWTYSKPSHSPKIMCHISTVSTSLSFPLYITACVGQWMNNIMLVYFWLSFVENAGSLYSGNLKAELDYSLIYGTNDLPHSIGYTINGEPGDLCPCSKGMIVYYILDFTAKKYSELRSSWVL